MQLLIKRQLFTHISHLLWQCMFLLLTLLSDLVPSVAFYIVSAFAGCSEWPTPWCVRTQSELPVGHVTWCLQRLVGGLLDNRTSVSFLSEQLFRGPFAHQTYNFPSLSWFNCRHVTLPCLKPPGHRPSVLSDCLSELHVHYLWQKQSCCCSRGLMKSQLISDQEDDDDHHTAASPTRSPSVLLLLCVFCSCFCAADVLFMRSDLEDQRPGQRL